MKKLAVTISGQPRCLPWNAKYINLFLDTLDVPYDIYVCTDSGQSERFSDLNNIKSLVEISNDWQSSVCDRPLYSGEICGLNPDDKQKLISYSKHRMVAIKDLPAEGQQAFDTNNWGGPPERQFLARHMLQWIKNYGAFISIKSTDHYDRILKLRSDITFNYAGKNNKQDVKNYLRRELFNGNFVGYADRCFCGDVDVFEKLISWPFQLNKYVQACPAKKLHWCDQLPTNYLKYIYNQEINYTSVFDLITDSEPNKVGRNTKEISPYEKDNIDK